MMNEVEWAKTEDRELTWEEIRQRFREAQHILNSIMIEIEKKYGFEKLASIREKRMKDYETGL